MAAFASPIVPRGTSAWVSGLNFHPWPEILKRVVCDVVCMQIWPSGNRDGREGVGEREREGQFPSGASRSSGNRGCRARMCAHTCVCKCVYRPCRRACACTQTRARGTRARETAVYT